MKIAIGNDHAAGELKPVIIDLIKGLGNDIIDVGAPVGEAVDYPIPGNDDAIRAVKLIADVMANAVIEGKQGESFETAEEQDVTEEAETMEQVVAEAEEKVEE